MKSLTEAEINALKAAGINVQQFYAVVISENDTPMAIFEYENWAEEWKAKMCATAIIVPYTLQIK